VYSWNDIDPAAPDGSDARQHQTRGSASINLLGGLRSTPPDPSDARSFTVRVNNVCTLVICTVMSDYSTRSLAFCSLYMLQKTIVISREEQMILKLCLRYMLKHILVSFINKFAWITPLWSTQHLQMCLFSSQQGLLNPLLCMYKLSKTRGGWLLAYHDIILLYMYAGWDSKYRHHLLVCCCRATSGGPTTSAVCCSSKQQNHYSRVMVASSTTLHFS